MVVVVARITLHLPHAHSLKEKRQVVRKVVDRVQARHKVHLAEVDGQDTWQRTALGFAVVSGDAQLAESVTDEVVRLVEGAVIAEGEVLAVDRELLRYGAGQPFGEAHHVE